MRLESIFISCLLQLRVYSMHFIRKWHEIESANTSETIVVKRRVQRVNGKMFRLRNTL